MLCRWGPAVVYPTDLKRVPAGRYAVQRIPEDVAKIFDEFESCLGQLPGEFDEPGVPSIEIVGDLVHPHLFQDGVSLLQRAVVLDQISQIPGVLVAEHGIEKLPSKSGAAVHDGEVVGGKDNRNEIADQSGTTLKAFVVDLDSSLQFSAGNVAPALQKKKSFGAQILARYEIVVGAFANHVLVVRAPEGLSLRKHADRFQNIGLAGRVGTGDEAQTRGKRHLHGGVCPEIRQM